MNLLKFILKPYIKKGYNAYQIISLLLKNKTLSSGSHLSISHHRNIAFGNHVLLGDKVNLTCSETGTISLGDKVKIGPGCSLNSSGNNKISIGRGTSLHSNCVINGNVSIGKWCLFASNIFLSSHPHTFKSNPPLMMRDQDQLYFDINNGNNHIFIEDDCWLGWGVVVREGIRIGKGSIIGANSVVVKDVPPYSIVGGIPAKVIRNRLELRELTSIDAAKDDERIYFWEGFRARNNELVKKDSSTYIPLEENGKIMLSLSANSTLKLKLHSTTSQFLTINIHDFGFEEKIVLKEGNNNLEIKLKSNTSSQATLWTSIASEKKNSVMISKVNAL